MTIFKADLNKAFDFLVPFQSSNGLLHQMSIKTEPNQPSSVTFRWMQNVPALRGRYPIIYQTYILSTQPRASDITDISKVVRTLCQFSFQ
jgi:hypothetical protein